MAAVALWMLARMRFPALPASSNPVPPLLSQLANPSPLDAMASEMFKLQDRLGPALIAFDVDSRAGAAGARRSFRATALRVRDDLAVAVLPPGSTTAQVRGAAVLAVDPSSGLTVLRVAPPAPAPALTHWAPRRLERPQFFSITDGSTSRVSVRPVFVPSLEPLVSAMWADPIWAIPRSTGAAPGSFVITTAGELVGVVVEYATHTAIVPSTTVLAEADRLIAKPIALPRDVGVQVQALTPDLAAATGAGAGVVVAWVDPAGPAARVLETADVIESIGGHPVPTPDDWHVRVARLTAGTVTVRVHRRGAARDVVLRPAEAPPRAAPDARLGLRTRRVPRAGTAVIEVEADSAAARGGLAAGDVITRIGDVSSPTPAQVRAVFTAAPQGQPVLVAVTRGASRFVTTLVR
jgi:PDZ domain